jgi:hypothetical protein
VGNRFSRAGAGAAPARRKQEKSPAPSTSDPRAQLRELLRWSLCKTFVHQFSLIAKRQPPPAKKRQGGQGEGGGRQPFLRRPAIIKRAPGLAAVKHAQQVAARGALSERCEKASSALAPVQAAAKAEWPEAMKREMQACRTTEQQRLWSEKWAEHLAGRVASDGTPLRPSGGSSGAGGCHPS